MTRAECLRLLRTVKAPKLSLQNIAARSGISRAMLYLYLNEKHPLTDEAVERIAHAVKSAQRDGYDIPAFRTNEPTLV